MTMHRLALTDEMDAACKAHLVSVSRRALELAENVADALSSLSDDDEELLDILLLAEKARKYLHIVLTVCRASSRAMALRAWQGLMYMETHDPLR